MISEALRRLSGGVKELEAQSPPSLVLLAVALIDCGDREPAELVLRRAWRIKPDDFWVNFDARTGALHARTGAGLGLRRPGRTKLLGTYRWQWRSARVALPPTMILGPL